MLDSIRESLHALWLRLRARAKRDQVDRELDEELAFHLAMREARNRAEGIPEAQARNAARKQFGNAVNVKQRSREMWTFFRLETWWQDIRFGARVLRKEPGFTIVVVLTLALGIGANTAIFSVINAVLLRSLPYGDPARLVYIWTPNARFPEIPVNAFGPSNADFYDLQKQTKSFSAMALFNASEFNLGASGFAERVGGAQVAGNFFTTLESTPEMGRTIGADDDHPGHEHVVVISDALWRSIFGGESDILDRTVLLDSETYKIIGVMPPRFAYPRAMDLLDAAAKATDVWVPLGLTPEAKADRDNSNGYAIARLRPGISMAQAQPEIAAIMARLDQLHDESLRGWSGSLSSFREESTGAIRPLLGLLFGAVTMVLVISCSNAANLLLARAASRRHEMGVRAALGAARARLVRQTLTKAVLLALGGGALGLFVAYATMRILLRFDPGNIPRLAETSLDWRVLAFSAGVSMLTGIVFGILPALEVSRTHLTELLKQGSARVAGGASQRMRDALIVMEVGLAVILLAGAGLLLRSYQKLLAVDTGFSESTLTMRVALDSRYAKPEQRRAFFQNLLDKIGTLPGVRSVGEINSLPLSHSESLSIFSVEGYSNKKDQLVASRQVSPHFFEAIGTRMIAGRDFNEGDVEGRPPVVIVNQSFARTYFPGGSAIGGHFRIDEFAGGAPKIPWATVVGVVADIRHSNLEDAPPPQVYRPFRQADDERAYLAVRATAPPAMLIPEVRRAVQTLDRALAVADIRTMEERISEANARRKFHTFLLAVFAGIALFLAAIGLYGLVSYSVRQRTMEIGIRVALGAQRGDVLALVLKQGMALTLAGIVLGIAAALGVTRLLASWLYGVAPSDPLTLAAVCVALAFAALLACYLPARRAAGVDPMIALRYE